MRAMRTIDERHWLQLLAVFSSLIEIVTMIHPCVEAAGDDHVVKVFNGICYEFLNAKMNTPKCQVKGGSLVDLVDKETQNWLTNTVRNDLKLDWEYAYIGAWKDTGRGPWFGPHGNRISYSDWDGDQGGCTLLFDFMCIENSAVLNFKKNKWEDVVAFHVNFNNYICQYGIVEKICPFMNAYPNNVREYNGNCYEFNNYERKHVKADGDCKSKGGYLVEINNAETEKFILNTINELQNEQGWKWQEVYIGGFRETRRHPWRWGNYKKIRYNDFGGKYKDYYTCVVMDLKSKKWNDIVCTEEHYFVCQYKLPRDSETTIGSPMTNKAMKNNGGETTEGSPMTNKAMKDNGGETTEGTVYTLIAAILAAITGTVFFYQVYYKTKLAKRIGKSVIKDDITKEFWDEMMAEYYAFTIPEFDDDETCRLNCLNIPPQDFRITTTL